jgi:hypothetical protein
MRCCRCLEWAGISSVYRETIEGGARKFDLATCGLPPSPSKVRKVFERIELCLDFGRHGAH